MVVSAVQKGLTSDLSGLINIPWFLAIAPVFVSKRQIPISIISLTCPFRTGPFQQVASRYP